MLNTVEALTATYRRTIEEAIEDQRIDEALNALQDLAKDLSPQYRQAVVMLVRVIEGLALP